jgi:Flp pilus assembly protein protease CpaA
MSWEMILISVTLLFLVTASYSDIKKFEVPDWLSYGLIFSALGLRFIFSFENGWMVFLNGFFGFFMCFGFAYLFYFLNQWGGGDSKLLMGMGAVIGLSFNLLYFFFGLLFLGALWGLLWSLIKAIRNWKKFNEEFNELLKFSRKWHYLILLAGSVFLAFGLFYGFFWILTIFLVIGFYLIIFIKAVEKSCFIKEVPAEKLVEGDWLAENVKVNGKIIVSKGKALQKKEIWKLIGLFKEGEVKRIIVKEGIPLVPGFLFTYLILLFVDLSWFFRFLS